MSWIIYDKDTFNEKAVEALKRKYPEATVNDEKFNNFFTVYFKNGDYGQAGIANGDLEVDIYFSGAEQATPDNSETVATVFYDNLSWVGEVYYPLLEKAQVEDTDFVMQQSISASIGWVNCLKSYDIEPTQDDMDDFMLHYIQLTGEDDEEV